jgi:hypothetical protein
VRLSRTGRSPLTTVALESSRTGEDIDRSSKCKVESSK